MVFKAETVDEYFTAQNLSKIEEARSKAKLVLEEVISQIKPGKKESELYEVSKEIYNSHGITRSWHKPYIRFGTNTALTYDDQTSEDISLKEEDIAFVDIGPIFDEIEGDLGRTIVFGDNQKFKNLQLASEELFEQGLNFFRTQNPTGIQMQAFIKKEAEHMGYHFALKSCGHLLGLFSHTACWNKGIAGYEEKMQSGIWVLEIQLLDKERKYGAFYENLLIN